MVETLTYSDAGVNIDKANLFVDEIKKIAKQTHRRGVLGDIGGFGALFSLQLDNFERPVLVSSTDGVGTKLKIAVMMEKHDTIGIDLVAMCVNDIAVHGAKPLFFLDYLSMGKLDTQVAAQIIQGIGAGCKEANCALIGGETAEMPGLYAPGDYDLAGFVVGIVDNSKIIDGSVVHVGNKIIGIASTGLHSNGYSLVRKICFDLLNLKIDAHIPELGCTIGEELLKPTRIYSELIQGMLRDLPIHGLAHITGGGITENLLRIIPKSCQVVMRKNSWEVPPVFKFLQATGKISDSEMMRTFNNGIGLIAVVPDSAVQDILDRLGGMKEKAYVIGEIVERDKSAERLVWE
jgi:phosphoribosylformylglycinamidine cyclo-ligase